MSRVLGDRSEEADLEAAIAALQAELEPRLRRLAELRRALSVIKAGRASGDRRREALAMRNKRILADYRDFFARGGYVPPDWQEQLARKYKLSTRQVRRVIRALDINVVPLRSRPPS